MNLLTIEHLTKSYTERLLFDDTAFSINEGEKVGLIGINGTGKSTLLRIAAGLEQPDEGSVVKGRSLYIRYLPQIPEFQDGETVLEAIVRENENEPHFSSKEELKAAARSMLNRLEVPDCEAKIDTLSGGQRKRVALASVLLSTADLLILDEPTNHLDITSKEILEKALNNYTGTVLFVSHDRYFINQTATRILELINHKFVNYIGNYDYYLEKKETLTAAYAGVPNAEISISAKETVSDSKLSWQEQKEAQAKERKRLNDLKKTENHISELEERDAEIDELMTREEIYTNSVKCQELSKEKSQIALELETLYERWESLAE